MVARPRQGQRKAKDQSKEKSETKQQKTIQDKSNKQGMGESTWDEARPVRQAEAGG